MLNFAFSLIKVKCLNPFPNKPWFLRLLKTLWEKEKLLMMSNFSFSHSVFLPFRELPAIVIKSEIVVCKLFQFGRVKNLSFRKGLKKKKQSFNGPEKNQSAVSTVFGLH